MNADYLDDGDGTDSETQDRKRFHEGHSGALLPLLTPHLDAAYQACLRVTRSPADAEDAVQEAVLRALLGHRQYDPARPFRPWFTTIALNIARDRVRGVWWRRVHPTDLSAFSHEADAEFRALRLERENAVRRAVSRLPPGYREAVTAYHLDEANYHQMSSDTGISVAALKQRVSRGRSMLRAALTRRQGDARLG